jgi:hypothetical protein
MPTPSTVSKLLTDEIARDAPPPAAGNRIYYDGGDRSERVAGFGLRVTAAGYRAFGLTYRIDGVQRRDTIGHFPAWSVEEAHDEARRRRRQIEQRRNDQRAKRRSKIRAGGILKSLRAQRSEKPVPDASETAVGRCDHPQLAAAPAEADLSLITPEQLAAHLGINPMTLRRWRKQRIGPPAAQFGRNIWYRRDAVKAWLIALEQEGSR